MKNVLRKVSRISERIEEFIVCFSIVLIMLNSTANAMGRYFFGKSIFFSEELNQFLIVSVTFIGFAYAVRKGRNIRMTAVYDSLGHRSRKVITTAISITTAMLLFYLAYKAFFYVQELKDINRLSPALEFPVYIIYSIIPIGLAMAGLQYLISFVMNLLHREIHLSHDVIEGATTGLGDSI
ncbi:C4-dicarboxylate ABC transporter permease [Parazoarcus communis]|uniref:TRAP transporter small permease protein n=1 Tax=Parazoarcus communis TaxID=41977 RepID=A0A2U8GMN0_9RHOO|nr:TRAP transporter small permease [Parazoarcus communis]AWI74720.1 C4-dicarboxylate ABC transporter permease [Parazoarcus communis]|tara:strand:+ start:25381 stop:25923 length:543 start_codon:yes stop_codon:yes gene_type:complete